MRFVAFLNISTLTKTKHKTLVILIDGIIYQHVLLSMRWPISYLVIMPLLIACTTNLSMDLLVLMKEIRDRSIMYLPLDLRGYVRFSTV